MAPTLRNILCIDDEEDILLVTKMSLENLGGYRVSTCKGSAAALDQARSLKPDIILLDVMMPGMDGPTTLKHFQADPEVGKIPVIFMTAKVQPAEVDRYLKIGAAGVIGKPFDPLELPRQLEALWEEYHESA